MATGRSAALGLCVAWLAPAMLGCGGDSDGGAGGAALPPCDPGPRKAESDIFDPGQVYAFHKSPIEQFGAISHWSTPDVNVGGLKGFFTEIDAIIRPTDGRIVYNDGDSGHRLHEFRCDDCAPNGGLPTEDPSVPTPGCTSPDTGVLNFLVSPDGPVIYECHDKEGTWFDTSGNVVFVDQPDGDELLHLGYGGLALTSTSIVDLSTGEKTPIVGLPRKPPFSPVRARPTGSFLMVMDSTLWELGSNGVAIKQGTYSPLPSNWIQHGSVMLEACGGLLQVVEDPSPSLSVPSIVRYELNGPTTVMYEDHQEGFNVWALITAP